MKSILNIHWFKVLVNVKEDVNDDGIVSLFESVSSEKGDEFITTHFKNTIIDHLGLTILLYEATVRSACPLYLLDFLIVSRLSKNDRKLTLSKTKWFKSTT